MGVVCVVVINIKSGIWARDLYRQKILFGLLPSRIYKYIFIQVYVILEEED